MKNRAGKIKKTLAKAVSFWLAACFFALLILPGCTLVHVPVSEIVFLNDSLAMRVGDEIRIDSALVEVRPVLATNKNFKLESSDLSVLRPNYLKVVEAVGVGEAVLTVISDDNPEMAARLTVTVDYAVPDRMRLVADDELKKTQYLDEEDDLHAVEFSVEFPGFEEKPDAISPQTVIEWQGGGVEDTERGVYSFQPEGQGSHPVKAVAHFADGITLEASDSVNVYKRFPIRLKYPADLLLQEESAYKTVAFLAEYENAEGNPPPVIVWYCNEEPITGLNNSARFPFLPDKAGRYKIRLMVNGENIPAENGDSYVEVVAKGTSTPQNIEFDFDTYFPAIVLSWDAVKDEPDAVSYAVRINTVTGGPIAIDAPAVNFFTGNNAHEGGRYGVDLSGFIGKDKATNIFNTRFSISVKSLGGDIYTPSAYSLPIQTEIVPIAAQPFLEKTYYNGYRNYYASDSVELCDIYTYTTLTRANQYRETGKEIPSASFSAYIGFSYTGTAKSMLESAFALRHMTGDQTFSFTITGQTATVTVSYYINGLPQVSTPPELAALRPTFNSAVPHINFTAPGAYDRILPISKRRTVTVSTTEQLYIAAEEGFDPRVSALNTPEANTARNVYSEAQSVLKRIITDEVDDLQKVHAIYDYVMWRTVYDEHATRYTESADAVRDTAYYLDGIFGARNLAVCDGIAKAVSLLCNMENIPAIRIAGKAKAGQKWEGHAWNKVRISGEWYIVDATWGKKPIVDARIFGSGLSYDVAGHRYFLRTDTELAATHLEDAPNNYPRTAREPFGFYEKGLIQGGSAVDFFMDSLDSNTESQKLADYLISEVDRLLVLFPLADEGMPLIYYVGLPLANNYTQVHFVSFDIRIHALYQGIYQATASSPLTKALEARGLENNHDFYTHTEYSFGEMYQRIFLTVHLPDDMIR